MSTSKHAETDDVDQADADVPVEPNADDFVTHAELDAALAPLREAVEHLAPVIDYHKTR